MGKILYLNVGKPELKKWKGEMEQSAIGKKGVKQAFLTKNSFEGDGVAATEYHGGPDRAVCFYPVEHYQQWSAEFKKNIDAPTFGENISAHGMKEADVYIGDIYRLGEVIIQVSQGRIPCSKISKNNGIDLLLKRVVQTGYTGYFFRVLEEGVVEEDAEIVLLERKQDDFSILMANEILFHRRKDIKAIESLIGTEGLAVAWKEELNKLLMQKN
ncbi:MOSC domain-containing protein [Bacillus sp. ISL-35]|uniref:MOSC domain-containing protein n=1 Tax=Bacillus sp. ISL-35 TaxID=2819122 RepID=UPI001BE88CF9|nr:MOSC domain-containing protein [Bacillus sp. ISL-35]MBT2677904.1 MOSC domain-containing protein [Bacillus sp. ISL-35]MBT2704957.1 MOSC domain-containing protein [Chryseobacterium sp. ISL-80]